MKQTGNWGLRAAVAVVALLCVLAPRPAAAQNDGVIRGQILDVAGKPWANLGIQAISDQGTKFDAKTDEKGNYILRNLRHGIYTLNILLPGQPQPYEAKVNVPGGNDTVADLNFKDIVAKQGAQYTEAVKKQEEEKQKFESVKTHFAAGNAILEQMKQVKNDLQKAPADQRDALKRKLADLSNQAATEYEAAQKGTGEKDQNQPLFWAKLGEAYDVAGRTDDAINAYQQAVTLKPDVPGYHNNLGNVLAKAGKIDEAKAEYMKSVQLDPASAAQAWRNFGIVLYNVGRMKDAVEPLQKASELDPKSAQNWYLLGAALVGAMDWKKESGEMKPIILPGTVEAYEKAIQLDPNGAYGQQAKLGLEELQKMAPGIKTSYGMRKKKS